MLEKKKIGKKHSHQVFENSVMIYGSCVLEHLWYFHLDLETSNVFNLNVV